MLKSLKQYGSSPLHVTVQIISHILAYTNSCVNPVLYAFLSDNFRKAFRKVSTIQPHSFVNNVFFSFCFVFRFSNPPVRPHNNVRYSIELYVCAYVSLHGLFFRSTSGLLVFVVVVGSFSLWYKHTNILVGIAKRFLFNVSKQPEYIHEWTIAKIEKNAHIEKIDSNRSPKARILSTECIYFLREMNVFVSNAFEVVGLHILTLALSTQKGTIEWHEMNIVLWAPFSLIHKKHTTFLAIQLSVTSSIIPK